MAAQAGGSPASIALVATGRDLDTSKLIDLGRLALAGFNGAIQLLQLVELLV